MDKLQIEETAKIRSPKIYDLTDMESVKAYSRYLAMKGQLIGLTTIDGHRPTDEEVEVQSEIRRTSDKLAKVLPDCRANEIASLTGYYSILYTIGYRKLPDASILEKQRDRLFFYWMSGDKEVAESDVYGMLADSMHNPICPASPVRLQTLDNLRDRWIRTLKRFNSFPDTDTCERYKRLALIMRDNIDPYFGGDSTGAKEMWYKQNKIADISTVGSKILTAYRLFVCSLFPAVLSSKEMTKLDIAVLKELITRKDLNDYDRKAYQMALTFEAIQDA